MPEEKKVTIQLLVVLLVASIVMLIVSWINQVGIGICILCIFLNLAGMVLITFDREEESNVEKVRTTHTRRSDPK
ncbi:hypothetical protein [Enterococcus sp. AZ072]|uniref:hypothetical protein n=1 Tax=unclassified Enterococcus TaxID=2608891 RepID=UPI003D2C5CC1